MNSFSKIGFVSSVVIMTIFFGSLAFADGGNNNMKVGQRHSLKDQRMELMKEELALNSEQATKIRAIYDAASTENLAVGKKMIQDITALLNDRQKAKYELMLSQRRVVRKPGSKYKTLKEELALSAEQVVKVEDIFETAHRKEFASKKKVDDDIRALLNDRQRADYELMIRRQLLLRGRNK